MIIAQTSPSTPRTVTTAVNKLTSNNLNVTVTPQSAGHRGTKSNAALTITQLNNPVLTSGSTVLQQIRPKMVSAPPGLISLHPGTNRPVNQLVKIPQSQKIKFPITKNWRPNLIPIDPTKKQERKAGLVQVSKILLESRNYFKYTFTLFYSCKINCIGMFINSDWLLDLLIG